MTRQQKLPRISCLEMPSGESDLIDLAKLIREMKNELVSIVRPDIRLHFGSLVEPLPPTKVCSCLRDLVLHLTLDAQDAMPEGGTLSIVTSSVALGPEYVRIHPEVEPGDYIMIAVRDCADKARRRRAGELSKGRAASLGAGHDLIAKHGGHIAITCDGRETVVKIYLRQAAQERSPAGKDAGQR